jgi:hypothetical protein
MLRGVTLSASEIAGTAVFRIVVSSDSIKKATATNHGRSRLLEADGTAGIEGELVDLTELVAMEWNNHFTSDSRNLLLCRAAAQFVSLFILDYFRWAFGPPHS